jgi:hypothetical protein
MMPNMTPSQSYLDTLLLYYEEEIMGEAYFRAVSHQYLDPDRTYKMELMAQVERHAANAVLPLVQKYGLTPRTDKELHDIGLADVKDVAPDWDVFIAEMQTSFPDYMPEFRALEEMGPETDQSRLLFLTHHEVAAIEFLDLEARKRDSVGPMLDYLRASPRVSEPL